jgi:predicted RNA binding protein with dsRBD fold (UPF0201 family)
MKSTPQEIENAANRFLNNEFQSLMHAESITGVARQTIQARINGRHLRAVSAYIHPFSATIERLSFAWTEHAKGPSP